MFVTDCDVPRCCLLLGVVVDCLWLVSWNSSGVCLLRHPTRQKWLHHPCLLGVPKRGRNGYITPTLWGVPNKGTKSEWATSPLASWGAEKRAE